MKADAGNAHAASQWGKWARRSIAVLGLLIGLYVGAGAWAVRGDLARAIQQVPWKTVPAVLGLVATGWGLRAGRWHYYVRHLRWPVSFHQSVWAFFASFAFSATPGKAGELVKSVLLRTRYEVPLAEGAGVLLVERLGDLLAVLLLAIGGLALLPDGKLYFALAASLIVLMTVFVCSRSIHTALLAQVARLPRLADLAAKGLRLLDTGRALLRPAPFLAGLGFAIMAWGCEGLAFHILVRHFGVTASPLTSISVFGIATVVGALSALPGGIGTFEAVMLLLLSRLGLPLAAATLPVVLFRFFTFWLGGFLGLLLLGYWLSLFSPRQTVGLAGDHRISDYPPIQRFESVSIIIPVINETVSLNQTVEIILRDVPRAWIRELLIVVCQKTTPPAMAAIGELQRQLGDLVVVLHQKLPFLGGALRDAIDVARGSHLIMMGSDLETNPKEVRLLIEQERQDPSGVVCASRWKQGGSFKGYSLVKLICNWLFQRFFSLLYLTCLSDMTFGFRILPTRLAQAIRWEEVRHPFNLESAIKPLRLGVPMTEIATAWTPRIEGESQNPFFRNFEYFRIGFKVRFARKRTFWRAEAIPLLPSQPPNHPSASSSL